MYTFEPPDLEKRLTEAIHVYRKILGEEPDSLFDDTVQPSESDPEGNSFLLNPQSLLSLYLPHCETFERSCEQFLDLVDELEGANIEQNLECWTKTRLLLRIAPAIEHEQQFFEDIIGVGVWRPKIDADKLFPIEVSVEGCAFRCLITGGLTPFGVLIAAGDDYHKFYPPVPDDELFVEVSFEGFANKELIRNLAYAYLFEISTGLKVDLLPHPWPPIFAESDRPADITPTEKIRFRPLMIGKGITQIIYLYQKAVISSDPETQLLQFYKVFEHVSQTVVHLHLIQGTRGKLLSTSALNPDATFILELQALFEQHRNVTRDREAIKLTFKTCCEVTELSRVAPSFLKEKMPQLSDLTNVPKLKDRQDLLEKIGECIVATRNALAHSKAAYDSTGAECPSEELVEFIECAKVAAQQVIRWYDSQPQDLRIV